MMKNDFFANILKKDDFNDWSKFGSLNKSLGNAIDTLLGKYNAEKNTGWVDMDDYYSYIIPYSTPEITVDDDVIEIKYVDEKKTEHSVSTVSYNVTLTYPEDADKTTLRAIRVDNSVKVVVDRFPKVDNQGKKAKRTLEIKDCNNNNYCKCKRF